MTRIVPTGLVLTAAGRQDLFFNETSFNVYDSLGEACMKNGQNDLARANFKRSLELNPKNENARKLLEQLGKK